MRVRTLLVWLLVLATLLAVSSAIDHDDDDMDEDDGDDWDFMSDDALKQPSVATRCIDTLPIARVNDGYCDCPDGSDELETSACSHVLDNNDNERFVCRSGDEQIPSAWVGDGVCDCCDGSDESTEIQCTNTCAERLQHRLERTRARLEVVDRGLVTRNEYAEAADFKVKALHQEFQRATKRIDMLAHKMQQLQVEFQRASKPLDGDDVEQYQRLQGELQYGQFKAYVLHNVVANTSFAPALEREAFSALVGECFHFTVNEKQLKGGSSNVVPREYVMRFCPFQNITQTEPGYAEWKRAERAAKSGVESENGDDEETTQRPIMLGIWGEWTETAPTKGDQTQQHRKRIVEQTYNHGEQCANEKEREVHVQIQCGDSNQVMSVDENEMCVYSLRFSTPAACTQGERESLAAAVKALSLEKESSPTDHDEL